MINSFTGKYEFLSNFYPSMIIIEGVDFPTVEHLFQCMKMTTLEDWKLVQFASSPGEAKRIARNRPKKEEWEFVKDHVMYAACTEKFKQHRFLRELLIATGDQSLIESNTWNDTYWGVCNGIGRNQLGITLMRIRNELR